GCEVSGERETVSSLLNKPWCGDSGLNGDGSFEYKIRRTCQRHVPVNAGEDLEIHEKIIAAFYAHRHGSGCGVQFMMNDGAGNHAGAASQSFIFHAAFVGADCELPGLQNLNKIHICAARREPLVIPDPGTEPFDVRFLQILHQDDGMWNP